MRKKATKKQILTSFGILLAMAAAGLWFWPHIYWSYMLSRNKFRLPPVKVTEMSPTQPPADWFVCRVGCFSMRLPPAMAEEAERAVATNAVSSVTLTAPNHFVLIMVPWNMGSANRPFIEQEAARLKLTPIQFIAESYRTGTDDFRWTMSRQELLRHQRLLDFTTIYPHKQVLAAETWTTDTVEGILVIYEGRSQAKYEWRLKSGVAAGYMEFAIQKGEIALADLRAMCQSAHCDESRLTEKLSNEELAVLADTMTVEPDDSPAKVKP